MLVDLTAIDGYPEKVQYCPETAYVYVLGLFDGRYYVGVTKHPKRRVISHARHEAVSPHWVKLYPVVLIESVIGFDSREQAREREDEITLALVRHYDPRKVRGGKWTAVGTPPPGDTDRSKS